MFWILLDLILIPLKSFKTNIARGAQHDYLQSTSFESSAKLLESLNINGKEVEEKLAKSYL